LPLQRPGDDDRGCVSRLHRLSIRRADGLVIVAVDLDRAPSEGASARGIRRPIPAEWSFAALTQSVHIEDRDDVAELVVARVIERLPNGPLRHLTVANEHPYSVRQSLEVLGCDRDPDRDRQALSQRSGGDVDPREPGDRVALEPA